MTFWCNEGNYFIWTSFHNEGLSFLTGHKRFPSLSTLNIFSRSFVNIEIVRFAVSFVLIKESIRSFTIFLLVVIFYPQKILLGFFPETVFLDYFYSLFWVWNHSRIRHFYLWISLKLRLVCRIFQQLPTLLRIYRHEGRILSIIHLVIFP